MRINDASSTENRVIDYFYQHRKKWCGLLHLSLLVAALAFPSGCNKSNPPSSTPDSGSTQIAKPTDRDAKPSPTTIDADLQLAANSSPPSVATSAFIPKTAQELVELRRKMDESVWSKEVMAQQHEETFVHLWDRLIHEADKFQVFREFSLGKLLVGTAPQIEELDWGIQRVVFDAPLQEISANDWPQWLAAWEVAGYKIVETEFHHSSFQDNGTDRTSMVSFLIHARHVPRNERYIVRGNLAIQWRNEPDPVTHRYVPETINASDLFVLRRQGEPAFEVAHVESLKTDASGRTAPSVIHPLIVHDLDGDTVPEIVLGGFNRVYRRQTDGSYKSERLCATPIPNVNAGAFADFSGDGVIDYLCAPKNGFPHLYVGSATGRFDGPGVELKIATEKLLSPVNVVPGDIDNDGDLDVFIGQQKPGYFNGDIPTPYYDANDSFPSFLLQNDGHGKFVDIINDSGLQHKAHRRNFAATFLDYDEDGDADLLMTSDFSGSDLFNNDGQGHFTDATETLTPRAYAFGMSHTFGDYNLDNKIDFLTVGMSSTTARRLEKLKLRREDFPDYDEARMKMGYGNRLFLNQTTSFDQAPFNETVARTGWSWGSTTLDFDNDGDQDIYVVNGQTSGKTTKDYCTRFWCHDVYYKRGERPDAAIQELFTDMAPLFSGNQISWNGYEHNALLMNVAGNGFVNIGYLMGVAFEFDSRAAASADLDNDGRVDLLVEHKNLRDDESNVYLVTNQWDGAGHWIGVHLQQSPTGPSPIGARVRAYLSDGRILLQYNVAGHSVWVQHANTVHFGVGSADHIDRLEIQWPGGETTSLDSPPVDQYHAIQSPPTG